jgi:hypothetical protein
VIARDRLEGLLDQIHHADMYSDAQGRLPKQEVLKAFDEALVEHQRGEAATELLAEHVRARVQAEMELEAAKQRLEHLDRIRLDAAGDRSQRDQVVEILGRVRALHQEVDGRDRGRCKTDRMPWPCDTEMAMRVEVPE